jgi:ferric iron reductase protein FhuF
MSAGEVDLRTALNLAATVGPFAAVSPSAGPDWARVSDFLGDRDLVVARIDAALDSLSVSHSTATPDQRRAAASVLHLGLSARLTAPVVATAALAGWLPELDPVDMWWRIDEPNPVPLAIPEPRGLHVTRNDELAEAFQTLVVRPVVAPLVIAISQAAPMSAVPLWGNVWSGLVGGLGPIHASSPDHAARAVAIVDAILDREARRHPTGRRHPGHFTPSGRFRRTTCCLLYRLPAAMVCGDCVLLDRSS